MGTSGEGSRDTRLAGSYLDDLEKAIKEFPQEFFSYQRLSGQFLGQKERLIQKLLDDESKSAFAAIDRAQAAGIDEPQLRALLGRAHRLTGVLWSAMSCTWLGVSSYGEDAPDSALRRQALSSAADHLRKAVELETGPDQAYSLYRLGEMLRSGERFDEANEAFQRIIDTWPDSQTAVDAMKEQERIQKARQEAESRKPAPTASKSGPCFIATAVYGSPMAREVQHLRNFRDLVLLQSRAGSVFVALYERVGPFMASAIACCPTAKAGLRVLLLKPALWLIGRCWDR